MSLKLEDDLPILTTLSSSESSSSCKKSITKIEERITIPTIRMGYMIGQVEKSATEAIEKMAKGVNDFLSGDDIKIKEIVFVVYNDHNTLNELRVALGDL